MELKVKFLGWSAGIPVAMLNNKTASKMGVHTNNRVSLKHNSHEMDAITDIVGDLVKEKEIAVSSEIKKRMKLKKGQKINVNLADPSKSIPLIKKKLNKKHLSEKEITSIVEEIVDNSLSDPEIALFVSAMHNSGMNMKETIYLIKAILKFGNHLKLKSRFIVDKHCIGGIAGNRTTPIVVSICAAAGLIFPKSSSRAITSAAGTADVIETIANVEFSINELKKIIKKTNACMIWGGALGIVPADSKIIQIEKLLKLDPESQLLASILSKKLAVDSNYILIDIPYGKHAKVTKQKALRLKRKFEYLGKYFRKNLKVVLTDGNSPIGNGIGPALELIDVIKVLDPLQDSPKDLEEKSLFLAGEILEMTKKAKENKGIEMARKILSSGNAFKKFKQIIKAQKGDIKKIKTAKFKKDIDAKKSGKIILIHNKKINSLARIAGCPIDKAAGVYLHCAKGDGVKKNEKLITIYSESKSRLRDALDFYKKEKPIMLK